MNFWRTKRQKRVDELHADLQREQKARQDAERRLAILEKDMRETWEMMAALDYAQPANENEDASDFFRMLQIKLTHGERIKAAFQGYKRKGAR